MIDIKKIAAGTAIAGALGFAAIGIGTGVANAAPSPVVAQTAWAENPGGHGPGPWGGGPGWRGGRDGRDWNYGRGWNDGPGWGPPIYGYGGYYGQGGCVTGPLGLLHFCN
ncbi:MAG: hypothetical protein ABW188_07265 [Rhodococcus fascians]